MPKWLSDPSTPAWVQAVGSVLAILVAVWIPARQRSKTLQDAQVERARLEREHRKRLAAGLRAEIDAAVEAANRWHATAERSLSALKQARARGATIANTGPIQPGSLVMTDAIVYREIAAELGQLPPALTKSVVLFYTVALDLGRIAGGASTAQQAFETIQGLAPRFKMNAAILIKTLEKFEIAGFSMDADLSLTLDEMRELATKTGYPLDQVLKERGFST